MTTKEKIFSTVCIVLIGVCIIVNMAYTKQGGIPLPALNNAALNNHIASTTAHGSNGSVLGRVDGDGLYLALSSTNTQTVITVVKFVNGLTTTGTVTAGSVSAPFTGLTGSLSVSQLPSSVLMLTNQSTTYSSAGFSTDTYVTGSSVTVPTTRLKTGTRYHALISLVKTAASTSSPVVTIRYGTNGTTGDAAVLTLASTVAQTAGADQGTYEIWVTFRSVGATAAIQGTWQVRHSASSAGIVQQQSYTLQGVSTDFDSTPANSIIGISINAGLNSSWTMKDVWSEVYNFE